MKIYMKNYRQTFKKSAGIIGMIFLLALTFTSCLKKDDNNIVTIPASLISVINLSPGSQPLDFYLDQNKVNATAFGFADGIDYFQAAAGKREASFYISSPKTKLKSDTIKLEANKAYSLYLANLPTAPQYLLLNDTLTQPSVNKAVIRFVNLSPDAPAVDLAIKDGNIISANKSFKGFSAFTPVPGNAKVTLEVRQTGTATVLASITDFTPRSGFVYTVFLQGLVNATDQTKLAANVLLNAYY